MEQRRPQFEGMHHVLVAVPPDAREAAHRYYEDVLGFFPVAVEVASVGSVWQDRRLSAGVVGGAQR